MPTLYNILNHHQHPGYDDTLYVGLRKAVMWPGSPPFGWQAATAPMTGPTGDRQPVACGPWIPGSDSDVYGNQQRRPVDVSRVACVAVVWCFFGSLGGREMAQPWNGSCINVVSYRPNMEALV